MPPLPDADTRRDDVDWKLWNGGYGVAAGAASDVPADGNIDGGVSEPETDAAYERLDAARRAMTGPINAAFYGASVVYGAFRGRAPLVDVGWFDPASAGLVIPLVSVAVPFVRTWPDAPVEALYRTLQAEAPDLGLEEDWQDLAGARRIAFETFRDVLVATDRMVAAEHRRILDRAGVHAKPVRMLPIDETTLELVDEPLATAEVGARVGSAAEPRGDLEPEVVDLLIRTLGL